MNQQQVISLVVFLALATIGYFVSEALKARLTPSVRRWLRPLVETMFPHWRMEPWLFEPIAEGDLPTRQRRFFETHTPGFIAHGFAQLGDFVLRRDAEPSCVRLFLSRDRTVIGELNCYLGEQVIGCVSVLLDGFYLESASIDCPQPPPAKHGLQFFTLATDDARELIEHHAGCMAKLAAARRTSPAPLDRDDIQAALNYGRQLSLCSLQQQGVLDELPEFLRVKTREAEEPTAAATN